MMDFIAYVLKMKKRLKYVKEWKRRIVKLKNGRVLVLD